MEVTISADLLETSKVDCLTLPLFEKVPVAESPLAGLDETLGGVIADLLEAEELKGKAGERTYLHHPRGVAAKRLLLVGCGKAKKFNLREVQAYAGGAARFARAKGHKSLGLALTFGEGVSLEAVDTARVATEAVAMALFEGDRYKEKPEERTLDSLTLAGLEGEPEVVKRAARQGLVVGRSTNVTRELVNTPGNDLPPVELAARAEGLAKEQGLGFEVLDRQAMEALSMGALLGVAAGSAQEPRLIVLTYEPQGEAASEEVLGLVGKGITFDTGGISLKPSKSMEKMKYDMAGGAAVIGAMVAIAQLKPPVKVVGVVPAVENMPGASAQRPGDVCKAASGKTIEVINTDAEGRLVLADALWYAREKLGATHLVDLATLTGAVSIALGDVHVGLLGNNQQLMRKVKAAGAQSGERLWQLPLDSDYRKQLKSDIADLKNVGGRKAGTITAAYFLKEFAGPVPWAHLDIAGTAWLDKAKGHLAGGATGVGVRTLVNLALEWS